MRTIAFIVIAAGGIVAPSYAADLQVHTDFASGSAEAVEIDQTRRVIRLDPTKHVDRGWACWWYVKVTGVRPGETLSLNVGDAPWATPDRAAFSDDGESWRQTEPGVRDRRRITYRQQVKGDTCWFAWGPPFTPADAQALVDETARNSMHAKAIVLCRTREDRPVPALVIEQANKDIAHRRAIWVQARQHAWEAGSSWVCRGLVEWLISDDPRAESLRKTCTITVVPIMDIDNVAIGAGGKNGKPQDHNRDWSDDPHWPSVRAATKQIKAADDRGELTLFVDLHNPGANSKRPFFYVAPRDLLTKTGRRNLETFLAACQLEMTGPLKFDGEVKESGAGYDKNWKKISKNWVTLNCREEVVAVTLETAWNTPHSQTVGYRLVGKQLGAGIARYIRTTDLAAE